MQGEVWIVGASQGLGYEVARRFARRGRTVVGMARRTPGDVSAFADFRRLDVGDADAIDALVADLYRQGRAPGLILYMAARVQQGPITDLPEAVLREEIDTNYLGFVRLCRSVAAHKTAAPVRIVAAASTLGYVGCPSLDGYSASKAALISFVRSARCEFEALGIKLVVLSPPHMENGVDLKGPQVFGLAWSADRFAKAAERGRPEYVLGASNRLMVWMSRFMPRLAEQIMRGIGADALKRGASERMTAP